MNGVFVMAGDVFNNSNFKSLNILKGNALKSKKPQVGFTITRVEPQFPGGYEPFNVYFKFENTGHADAGEFIIRMITECLDDSSLGVDQEDQVVYSLKPGEKEEIVLMFKHGMFAGNYVINAYLDYYNQIHDKNENMTCRHTSFDLIIV
jgi:hypothetical protein